MTALTFTELLSNVKDILAEANYQTPLHLSVMTYWNKKYKFYFFSCPNGGLNCEMTWPNSRCICEESSSARLDEFR